MTVKDVMATIYHRTGISQTQLAKQLGYKSPSSISVPLSRNEGMGMRVDTLIKWIEEMDCQIIIQSAYDDSDDLILDGWSEGITYRE